MADLAKVRDAYSSLPRGEQVLGLNNTGALPERATAVFENPELPMRSKSMRLPRRAPSGIRMQKSLSKRNVTLIDSRKILAREVRNSRRNIYAEPQQYEKQLSQRSFRLSGDQTIEKMISPEKPATLTGVEERGVNFSAMSINLHPIIVGDNPGGTMGPPLTIGWKAVSVESILIDDYEEIRKGNRRTHKSMQMKSKQRKALLSKLGFTMAQMNEGLRSANIARNKRKQTNSQLENSDMHEKIEKITRGAANILTLGAKKRKEHAFLEKHVPSYRRARSHKYGLDGASNTI